VFKVVSGLAYVDVVQVVSGCLVRVVYVWLAGVGTGVSRVAFWCVCAVQ